MLPTVLRNFITYKPNITAILEGSWKRPEGALLRLRASENSAVGTQRSKVSATPHTNCAIRLQGYKNSPIKTPIGRLPSLAK